MEDNKEIGNVVIGGLQEHSAVKSDGICPCLTSAMGMGGGQIPLPVEIIFLGNRLGHGTNYDGAVYDPNGLSPTILSRDYKGAKEVIEVYKIGGAQEELDG